MARSIGEEQLQSDIKIRSGEGKSGGKEFNQNERSQMQRRRLEDVIVYSDVDNGRARDEPNVKGAKGNSGGNIPAIQDGQ